MIKQWTPIQEGRFHLRTMESAKLSIAAYLVRLYPDRAERIANRKRVSEVLKMAREEVEQAIPPGHAECPQCKRRIATRKAYGTGPAVVLVEHDRPNFKRNSASEIGPRCPGSGEIATPSPIALPDDFVRRVAGGTYHSCSVCGDTIRSGEVMVCKRSRFSRGYWHERCATSSPTYRKALKLHEWHEQRHHPDGSRI